MVGPKHVRDAMSEMAQNFDRYVDEYQKNVERLFRSGKTEDLKQELASIQSYLDLYYKDNGSSVCDTTENITFYHCKQKIIENFLSLKND
ncbi:hypothetical protein [Candidatus Uabimicrobium sp. HlEnr_7]|uniref:hypothetical protein n=1 Tax=Candidatus Uabimicrobium helgolandensis TaxID=3095367 RepID=UPI003559198C